MMEKVREALKDCYNCKHENDPTWFEPCDTCDRNNSGFKPKPELEAELKAAIEALEKQTAKKVMVVLKRFPQVGNVRYFYCPDCDRELYPQRKEEFNFCPNCSKKLDWGE